MLSRFVSRLREYGEEVRFAMRVCTDWGSLRRLLVGTILYHFANLFRQGSRPLKAFPVSFRLSRLTHTVWLRPLAGDIFIFYEIFRTRAYRLPVEQEAERVRWVIDCGANIGLTSLYFADRFPNAQVISVEPIPVNFELLQRNTAQIPRIIPIWGCISDSAGERCFSLDRPAYANSVVSDQDGCKVPAYTVSQIIAERGIRTVDILKIDIEGEEEKIFKQPDFLSHTDLLVIELHDNYRFAAFQEDLDAHDFEATSLPDQYQSSNIIAKKRDRVSATTPAP